MKKRFLNLAVAVALASGFSAVLTVAAVAAPKKPAPQPPEQQFFGREPWPGQRPVLLLPLQFGPGWNIDKERAASILPDAEQRLQQALQRTGKFSTLQMHRYNPLFLRAVQDKVITKEQVAAILAAPTVEAVQGALGLMRFQQPPLIAEFAMEEITTESGTPIPFVRAQVTGKLYEANDSVAIKTIVLTSDPQPLYYARKRGKDTVYVRRSPSERIMAAANNAFNQIATEFVAPIEDITLPEPVVSEGATVAPGAPAITPDGTAVDGRPVIRVPQGQVLGTFPAPRQ